MPDIVHAVSRYTLLIGANVNLRACPNTLRPNRGILQMRWLFVSVNRMSIGLGTLRITVLDNWMKGYSVFWWATLTLLTLFSIPSHRFYRHDAG